MATISPTQPATLEIPAAYLDDVRRAAIQQTMEDINDLGGMHDKVLAAGDNLDIAVEDRQNVLRRVNETVSALNQLFEADGDATITDTAESLAYTLGLVNRLLTKRLTSDCIPAEEPAALLDRLDEMQWAAGEALRLDPRLDTNEQET